MFRFFKKNYEPKTNLIEVELSTRCVARCPMCPRSRELQSDRDKDYWDAGFLPPKSLYGILENDLTIKKLNFCGAYGDPIYHPKLIEIVRTIHDKFPHIKIHIETNGSNKKEVWWKELASEMKKDDSLAFSIDGLENTNKLYRVNTNWDSIMSGVKIFRAHFSGIMIWKWIVFKHNQDQVLDGFKFAKSLGFQEFKLVESGRENNEFLRPTISMDTLNKQIENTAH